MGGLLDRLLGRGLGLEGQADGRKTGTVRFFSEIKGWGFVHVEGEPDGGRDVFVHHTGLDESCADKRGRKNLVEGDRVTFGVEETPKGRKAVDVRILDR